MNAPLRIAIDPIPDTLPERELIERTLRLDHCQIVELGCGKADLTRLLAGGGPGRSVIAFEVDEIQHAKNLARTDLPNVRFERAGAEAVPLPDACADAVFMFKSLHHVPLDAMDQALREVARVLKPGGQAWISEPIFAGAFNDLLKLFHNEEQVRAAAFAAIARAVDAGVLASEAQLFFNAPLHFPDFAAFERQVIGVTHTRHVLSPELHAEVERRFNAQAGPDGVRFAQPLRVDLLRKPA